MDEDKETCRAVLKQSVRPAAQSLLSRFSELEAAAASLQGDKTALAQQVCETLGNYSRGRHRCLDDDMLTTWNTRLA